MKRRTISFIAVLSVLLLWGCYPGGAEYAEDLDVVVTHHNPEYNFAAKATYAMPDSIVRITGDIQEDDDPVFIPNAIATVILGIIEDNMENLGWTRVDIDENPDLMLTPASWETTTIYYYYDYWYWWYGYYPGYGWPYYPPVYVSSYTTGSLMMNLMDKNELSANGHPIAQWTGLLNGIMTEEFDQARFTDLIDQAFEQSGYLSTN